MVGGKSKSLKCIDSKAKKDSSTVMKSPKKEKPKNHEKDAKKCNQHSEKCKQKASTVKNKKDSPCKNGEEKRTKASKISKEKSSVSSIKGEKKQKSETKGINSKQKSASKGEKPKSKEGPIDKIRKVIVDNVNKGKKRKLEENYAEKSKDKSETKPKIQKIDKTKCKDNKTTKKTETKKTNKALTKNKLKEKERKKKEKKKEKNENMTNSLLDIFSLVRMKREAGLNASARVNIMFEKIPPSPKTKLDANQNQCKSEKEVSKDSIKVDSVEKKNSTGDTKKEKGCEKSKKSSVKDSEGKKRPQKDKSKCSKDKKTNKDARTLKDKSNGKKKKEKSVTPVQGCVRRMASLNAQAIMTATKELEAEASERAARIDRYCVSWQCEPMATRVSSAAHWVDGLGKTCCVTQTSTCFTAAASTKTNSSMAGEESKLPAITLPETESHEDRPASVVDVTTHVAANTFLPPPQQCIGSFFSQSHSCIPPCSACCNSDGYMSTSQFKSFQLGSLSSLSSLQMMTYGHPGHPYRSAFSVPYNHTGIPHYAGYYSNNYYQPTTGPVIQSDPCIVSHHVPIQVPQAQVKVLIHNPDSSLDHCAFNSSTLKGSKEDNSQHTDLLPKRRSSSESKAKSSEKQKVDQLKPKRKYERKRSKSPAKEEPEKKIHKTQKVQENVIPAHGWSWYGEPDLKKIPNVVEGPPRLRKCFSGMKHLDGDVINVRDCVLLRSGQRKKDIPFVAKVSALWENPDDGEMMMSLLWYYRPEHTEAGRKPAHLDNELFACKHRDENSVACIDDKSYVLTYNEYCRYKAEQRRLDSNLPPRQNVVPIIEEITNKRNRMPPPNVNPDNVFLCRQVYDFRQHRILKNPS